MKSLRDRGMTELAEAERRVGEFHSLIERQRQLIEDLRQGGDNLTSAWTVYESLLISLSLSLRDRYRLRPKLGLEIVETIAA
jgi:hypothetical protein